MKNTKHNHNRLEEVSQFASLWCNYLNSGEINKVLSLYNEKAVLIPTFSSEIIRNKTGIQDYFLHLAARQNLRVELDKKSVTCDKSDNDTYVIHGLYLFHHGETNKHESHHARFTFVVNLCLEGCILHHHSSLQPRI